MGNAQSSRFVRINWLANGPSRITLKRTNSLWLGHESTTTAHRYVEADLTMKQKALALLEAPDTRMRRFRPPDTLMQFLQSL